jgi:hypothetical protein
MSAARQFGKHHQPAHLRRRLVVDAGLHTFDVLFEDVLLHLLLQHAVQHHHLQVLARPSSARKRSSWPWM